MKSENAGTLATIGMLLTVFMACSNPGKTSDVPKHAAVTYPTVRYLDLRLGPGGSLPSNPYVRKFSSGKKTIVFCGTNHLTSPAGMNDPMYRKIVAEFDSLSPEVCVNEGGDLAGKVYTSSEEAVRRNNEIGLIKWLGDSLHISTVNGDPAAAEEFAGILKRYTFSEFLAYIGTERFMWSMTGKPDISEDSLAKDYKVFIDDYIGGEGSVRLSPTQKTLDYFKASYQELVHRPFGLSGLEPTNPFDSTSKFQEVGRASKEYRDQFLLRKIDSLINHYNKVLWFLAGGIY